MRTHRYPRFEPRSLFRAPTWPQLLLVTAALIAAFAALRVGNLAVAAAFVAVGGLPIWPTPEGLTLGTRVAEGWGYSGRVATRRRTHRQVVPKPRKGETDAPPAARWPRPVDAVEVASHALGDGRQVGVVWDRGRVLCGLRLAAPAAGPLLTPEQVEELADDFAGLIAAVPSEVVDRVQCLLMSRHGGGQELLSAAADTCGPAAAAAVVREAAAQIASAVRHVEVVVVLRLAVPAQRSAKKLDGVLGVQMAAVQAAQHAAEALIGGATEIVGMLSPSDWRGLFQRHLFPAETDASISDPPATLPDVQVLEERWDEVWADEACHRSFWVAQWPQMPVAAGWWAPILSAGEDVVLSLTVRPEDPLRALGRLQWRANRAAASIGSRKARSIVKEREHQRLLEEMGDLADGHVPTSCIASVTVSASDTEQLERLSLRLVQATTRSRVRLGKMQGRQVDGWQWALPLCRGLGG